MKVSEAMLPSNVANHPHQWALMCPNTMSLWGCCGFKLKIIIHTRNKLKQLIPCKPRIRNSLVYTGSSFQFMAGRNVGSSLSKNVGQLPVCYLI